jgi:hypothetical protein
MQQEQQREPIGSKVEQRMWSILITVALAFGGIWLQNQYATVQQMQEHLQEYMRFVDDKYVQQKQYELGTHIQDDRISRLEVNMGNILESIARMQQDDAKRDAQNKMDLGGPHQ